VRNEALIVKCQVCEQSDWDVLLHHEGPAICSGGEIVKGKIPLVKTVCLNCGFVYTLKSPLDEDLDGYYQNEYSANLEDEDCDFFNFNTNASFRDTLNQFVLSYKFPETGRFLNIGCGKGGFEEVFVDKYPKWTVEGVDPSIRAIELARKRNPSVAFVVRKFEAADYEKESYDHVAIHTVLNRVPAGQFLADAVSLLKPSGILSIEVALFTSTPFQLYFADHKCMFYRDHFLHLANTNSLKLVNESLDGSLARFIFKKDATVSFGDLFSGHSANSIVDNARCIAKSWQELFAEVNDLKKNGAKVAFYGAGTSCGIILAMTEFPKEQIYAIYDETPSKIGRVFWGQTIKKLDDSIDKADAIVLCAGYNGIPVMKQKISTHHRIVHLSEPNNL
jgi:SAM-dependent methyltransferase